MLTYDIGFTNEEWSKMEYLYFLRNCYAHTNGRLDMLKENERNRLFELMKGYKTQLCLKDTRIGWQILKRKRTERFGIFFYEDMNKFENF